MAIQSVSDSQAWGDFLKATQSARLRNEAFTPVGTAEKPSAASAVKYASRTAVSEPVARTYAPLKPVQDKPVMGTRFDAYA